jgi:uncharacterized membrane protein YkvA (DUF1232 family)
MRIISTIVDWVTTPYTIFLILKDRTISRSVKLRAIIGLVIIFAYVVSPIDIIPDFIPLAGWIDDIVVVPLGLILVRLFTPGMDVAAKKARVEAGVRKIIFWTIFSIATVILLGLAWFGLLIYFIVRLVTR